MSEANAMSASAQEWLSGRALAHARRGLGWGLFSGAVWGLDGVLLGIALGLAPFTAGGSLFAAPLVGAALHDGIAACWLLLLNVSAGKRREFARALATRPGRIVCLAALCGGPVGMTGYALGIAHAGTPYAMAVSAVYPAVGALLAVVFLKERIPARAWFGIVVSVAGAMIIGFTPAAGRGPHFHLGVAFSLMAALGWGLESVLSTHGMDLLDPDIAINLRELVSFAVFLAVILPLFHGYGILAGVIHGGPLPLLAAAGLCGALSYGTWYRAMNMTGVGRAMALTITYALWSIVYAAALGRLHLTTQAVGLTPNLIIGAVTITIGALLVVANPGELLHLRSSAGTERP